jgi:hypothetical protein
MDPSPVRVRSSSTYARRPGNEFVESELVGLVKTGHKQVRLFGIRRTVQAVDGKKRISGRESRPLIAIHKGIILRQALP